MEKFAKLKYTELETKKVSPFETTFTLTPLERGFANTIGNAVRRTLLSSVSGVAPFAIKVEGVDHEFQTVKGITEDAVQLILNIKEVRFIYNPEVFVDGEIVKVSLKSKEGQIVASDLTLPAGVELANKNALIANVAKGGTLNLEIFLRAGRGFVTFSDNKDTIKEFGAKIETTLKTGTIIAVDSNFSPIERINYTSTELNTSAGVIQEKLTLDIKTDGSVEAKDALAQANQILVQHLLVLSDVSNIEDDTIFTDGLEAKKDDSKEVVDISSLNLSVRSYNCLKRAGKTTLDQLGEMTMDELVNTKNLGKKSVEEIIDKLQEFDIVLKGDA